MPSTEPSLDVREPTKGQCGCGNFRDPGTDPKLFMHTGGMCALVPQEPKGFTGYVHRTDVTLHACAVCWAIYAAPKLRRKRRD